MAAASDEGRAEVLLDVDYRSGAFEIVVANVGTAVARDVEVEFSRPLVGARDVEISALPLFRQLRTLPPGKEIRVFLDAAVDLYRRRETNTFQATVTWKDGREAEAKAVYRHDLDAYRGMPEMVARDRE